MSSFPAHARCVRSMHTIPKDELTSSTRAYTPGHASNGSQISSLPDRSSDAVMGDEIDEGVAPVRAHAERTGDKQRKETHKKRWSAS